MGADHVVLAAAFDTARRIAYNAGTVWRRAQVQLMLQQNRRADGEGIGWAGC